jgi:hypothetical protein
MPVDYKEGTWTIGVDGIGEDRRIISIIWSPDDGVRDFLFECGHEVVLSRQVSSKGVIFPVGQKLFVVELRDPTLSPKHYNFIGVYSEEFDVSAWIAVDDVVDSSQGDESNYREYTDGPRDDTPPGVH